VVATFDELPGNIKDAAYDQGAENNVKGVFHNGKTYLVLDKYNSTAKLEATIFHETYGHFGLRNRFGEEDLPNHLNKLVLAIGGIKGIRAAAKRYGWICLDMRWAWRTPSIIIKPVC
jgi:hypothetical protein